MNFTRGQKIVVTNLLVNGVRRNMIGEFIKVMTRGPNVGMVLVSVNHVWLNVKPEKVVDYNLFNFGGK